MFGDISIQSKLLFFLLLVFVISFEIALDLLSLKLLEPDAIQP